MCLILCEDALSSAWFFALKLKMITSFVQSPGNLQFKHQAKHFYQLLDQRCPGQLQ